MTEPQPRIAEPATADAGPPPDATTATPTEEIRRLTHAIEALTAKYEMEQAAHRQTLDQLIAQQQAHIETLQQIAAKRSNADS